MKLLPKLTMKDKYWRVIMREIDNIFRDVVFLPLYKSAQLPEKELKNSGNALEDAIAKGNIWFKDGKFWGKFNAAISRELKAMGAKHNPKSGTWTYSGALPASVSLAAASASIRFETVRKAVISTLDNLNIESIDNLGDLPDRFHKAIDWMEGDWQKAVKGVTIAPELTDAARNGIAADYAHDMGRYIKDWSEDAILELREKVQGMVYEGQRPDAIANMIQQKYGQSRRKAMFLAKQESGLMMAAFTSNRMKDTGITKFKWITMDDERVRKDHKLLDGKIFDIDNPPIINLKTGERGLPKQDFGCRCDMIPIVE